MGKSLDDMLSKLLTSERLSGARRQAFDRLPVPVRSLLRRAIQRDPLFERESAVVTVIVPVYNVERYLAECLRSIVNQSYSRLQIILVDDGSTDGSLAIAESYARRDKRVTLVRQENAGLGAARNTGLRHAAGDYVVFADSDDVVPPNAYREMLRSLEATGSDFVVGAYFRMSETTEYLPPWLAEVHAVERLGITMNDFFDGLANVFAWNKMFRMSFVERINLQFPEGIRYEDQYPLTRAYLLAERFDVIPEIVYKWRIRFDGSSITQNKRALADVRDRERVIRSVYDYLREHASAELFDAWVSKVCTMDLMPYLAEALHADEEYREVLREIAQLLAPHMTAGALDRIDVRTRVALHVLEHGTVEDLGIVMLVHNEMWQHLPTEVRAPGIVAFTPNYPSRLSVEIPEALLVLGSSELPAEQALNGLEWTDEELRLRGWAFVRHLDLAPEDFPVARVYLRGTEDAAELDLIVAQERQLVSRWARSKWPDYDPAGFQAVIGIDTLDSFLREVGEAELRVSIASHGIERDVALRTVVESGSAGARQAALTTGGARISPRDRRGRGLTLVRDEVLAVLDFCEALEESAQIRFEVRTRMSVQQDWQSHELLVESSARKLPRIGKLTLQSELYAGLGLLRAGTVSDGVASVSVTRTGRVMWRSGTSGAAISEVSLEGDVLVVRGIGYGIEEPEVSLQSDLHVLAASEIMRSGVNFTARIPLRIDEFGHQRIAPFGGYRLVYGDSERQPWARPSAALHAQLPAETVNEFYRLRLTRTNSGSLWFDLNYPSTDEETGTLGQARLQRWHREATLEVIPNSVFFQSYLGEQATDSALALHRELRARFPEMLLYWGVVDVSVALPEGAIPVVRYTRDWYDKISRSETLVNNIYFFNWFIKRPEQTYIQTWHGTPLKKIGRSYWEDRKREPIWIERMDRQAASWDYLVSPNPFCTEKFVEEFRYSGPVLETGYPRNDVLAHAPSAAQKEAIRQRLGLSESQKVVLYAPTWRDNKSAQAWVAEFVQLLDLERLAAELGDEYTLLVRGHGHNARAGSVAHASGGVMDVTFYPEINDLYQVADLVITDYSSVMFDFAVTQKPMLFFAPDLADYANGVRGFYFDYTSTVPGPVLFEQEEVAPAIRSALALGWEPGAQYRAFVERFGALEDGSAAARVVEAVWGANREQS